MKRYRHTYIFKTCILRMKIFVDGCLLPQYSSLRSSHCNHSHKWASHRLLKCWDHHKLSACFWLHIQRQVILTQTARIQTLCKTPQRMEWSFEAFTQRSLIPFEKAVFSPLLYTSLRKLLSLHKPVMSCGTEASRCSHPVTGWKSR